MHDIMFSRRRQLFVVSGIVTVALIIAGSVVLDPNGAVNRAARNTVHATASAPLMLLPAAYDEVELRDRNIAFYSQRMLEDRSSAADRATLASLLFARSRLTGSAADLSQAQSLARQSVALRTERNGQAFELLASVLMARHAFRDARSVMLRADSLAPDTPSHLALLGEIELELGEYDAAIAHFRSVHVDADQFTILARLARWHELTGDVDAARRLLTRAITRVDRRDDLPREQVAWFHFRLGELELRANRLAAADSAYHTGLGINAEDARILGGLARLEVARSRWEQVIAYGSRATAVQLDPATLGAMSTAYAALGDSVQAVSFAHAMSVSALRQPGAIHRAWGLFLLDHGTRKDRADVLSRARADLRERHDVYGHDLLAWALYRNGQLQLARSEMQQALSQHTQDAMLTEHARAMGVDVSVSPTTPVTAAR